MTKITKGVQCYEFNDWDHKGSCSVRIVTVESWGKVNGTVSYPTKGGVMSQSRVYVQHHAADFLPVADCADVNAEALRRAAGYAAFHRARYESILTHRAADASEGYLNATRADLAAIHEPRVIVL